MPGPHEGGASTQQRNLTNTAAASQSANASGLSGIINPDLTSIATAPGLTPDAQAGLNLSLGGINSGAEAAKTSAAGAAARTNNAAALTPAETGVDLDRMNSISSANQNATQNSYNQKMAALQSLLNEYGVDVNSEDSLYGTAGRGIGQQTESPLYPLLQSGVQAGGAVGAAAVKG